MKHTGLLHSQPFHIHGGFSAFIRRDGCVDVVVVSMSVAIDRAQAATCTKHTDSKHDTAQHENEQYSSLEPLLCPGKEVRPEVEVRGHPTV